MHANVIEDLIATLEDGRKGFEQAAEKLADTSDGATTDRMLAFAEQRADFSSELRSIASLHGITVDDDGTISGAVHRGWMSVKDALTGDDPSAILGAAETGEDHAVSEYEDALKADLPADVRTVIQRQATEVKRAHDEVRALRDSL